MDQVAIITVISIVVGGLTRLLKDDLHFFPTLPAKYRAIAAIVFGQLLGALEASIAGSPLMPALMRGLIASLTAIASHDVVIEGMRNGRELGSDTVGLKVESKS